MAFGQAIGRIQESRKIIPVRPKVKSCIASCGRHFSGHAADDDIGLSFNSMTKQSSSSVSAAPAKHRYAGEMCSRLPPVAASAAECPARNAPPYRALPAQWAAEPPGGSRRRKANIAICQTLVAWTSMRRTCSCRGGWGRRRWSKRETDK